MTYRPRPADWQRADEQARLRALCDVWTGQPWEPPHEPRKCAHCGDLFLPRRARARYCCDPCRVAAHRAPAQREREATRRRRLGKYAKPQRRYYDPEVEAWIVACVTCGFRYQEWRRYGRPDLFCSDACRLERDRYLHDRAKRV
jgi:hypothetical protein